jgi:membrane protease YdiL (CAAX protease family)
VVLLLTGHTQVVISPDPEQRPVSLYLGLVPVAAGLLLTRLVPSRLPPHDAGEAIPASAVKRAWILTGIAVLFPLVVLSLGNWYLVAKPVILLGGSLLALRMIPDEVAGGLRPVRPPTRWYWLGPVPAVLAWGYLLFFSPLAADRDLSDYLRYDRGYLVGAMLVTFLISSVTEELFFRVLLQSHLETVLGRWPAITTSALLFAAMHIHMIGTGPLWVVVCTILAWNGGLGLFTGYLWSRYRNVWSLVLVHGAVNALPLILLLMDVDSLVM